MTEAPALVIERVIRASRETVFSFFTDPRKYTRWMGVEARLDAVPGGVYEVRTPQGFLARGEFIEVNPPSRVAFTWGWEGRPEIPPGSSRVEITLTSDNDTTTVRLVHHGLPPGELPLHDEGWTRYLDRLVVAGSGGDPGPDEA